MYKHVLRMQQPATRWEDALPCGNGEIGAMIYGNIEKERILLNHENLWLPLFGRPRLPGMAKHLPRYRKLLQKLKFQEADRFYRRKLKQEGWPSLIYTDPFHPAFDLLIEPKAGAAFSDYERLLDLRTGEATVRWKEGATGFSRTMFVSRSDRLVVIRCAADRPALLTARIRFAAHPMHETHRKRLHYPRGYTMEEIPLSFKASARGSWARMDARYTVNSKGYGGLARVVAKGAALKAEGDALHVSKAREILILVGLTGEKMTPAVVSRLRKRIQSVPAKYATLLSRHARMHRGLYSRVSVNLSGGRTARAGNEELLSDAYRGKASNALVEKLFNYGRYLFISSTSTAGFPPNLQGVWNGDYIPAWSCDYTLDENVQMCHWQALPANLPELLGPYFDYFERSVRDWKANAKAFFGCRGVYTCLRQSNHGLMAENMPYMIWSEGAGWLAKQFYEYWLHTGDREFLRDRAVPFLKQVALFYEDFLYEDARGKYIICPTMSPENVPDVKGATRPSLTPTMAVAVCKEVLSSLCEACAELGIERRNVKKWRAMIKKLPAYAVNRDGAIREWLYPKLKDNYHHRHLSHLYPLFPGCEITKEKSPELFEACRIAVEKRLVVGIQSQTGWSLSHMAHIYARLGQAQRALDCMDLLSRSCLGINFLTYHNDYRRQGVTLYEGGMPPYQIDANMGLTSAVFEMLVFSLPGMVKLLPALPRRWAKGSVDGLLCRGGLQLSMQWNRTARTVRLMLRSERAQTVTVKTPSWTARAWARGATVAAGALGKGYWDVTLPARRTVTLSLT
jgi:alpha-L-fucosidase 2